MGGTARGQSALAWWARVGADMVRGDFIAVDAAVEDLQGRVARGESVDEGLQAVAWTASGAIAGLRGFGPATEVGFAEALQHASLSGDVRYEALVRIARAETTAADDPARAIDDARRVLGGSRTLSPPILHQARYALIAGHRAAGDLAIAVALGERLLASDLSELDRGRALAAHAVTFLAVEEREHALAALDESMWIFASLHAHFFAASTESMLSRLDPSRRDELRDRAYARARRHVMDPAWQRILDLPPELQHAAPTVVPSARELVVALVARGFTSRQIADALLIRPSTVETHVRRSLEMSGATSRAQLVGHPGPDADLQWRALSAEERELLELVAGGLTTKEIGRRLHLSSRTVTRRLRTLRLRFRVPSTPALVAAAAGTIRASLG